MKKYFKHKVLFFTLVVLVSGCSTKKNTWASRTYQATNTRFNVFFNGTISYNEGLKSIIKANKENYSHVIPMYPISHHENAKAATSSMDRTIEKSRKAIKLHSIKEKPKKNVKKANSPDYLLYYNQQEFNPALKQAWLQLAQAEFHKGNFLGSSATFSYITRHYANDVDVEMTCQLWIARAYAEMDWIYEAEQVLSKLKQDNLKGKNVGFFAAVNADLLLKKHQYKEAIPYLELTLSKEKDKDMHQRFGFVLAQLYQKTGNNNAAYEGFSSVIKTNPPYEMDFNARISRAQIDNGNVETVRKDLQKMLKNPNNKDYLDQIYSAIGNTYLQHKDTLRAIENYKLGTEKSTRNGIDKAVTLITLGDLYYTKCNFVKAQPCYEGAGKIITKEHDDFSRVTKRAETLGELVIQNDIVVLQDSLQILSAMSENERLEVVTKLIAKLNADEKEAAKKEAARKQAVNNPEDEMVPIGGNLPGTAGDWYFYNINLMQNGKSEFLKKWGKRKLEDNWRRTNKAASLFAEETADNTIVKDSTDTISKSKTTSDIKDPEFYLQQIPVTASQIAKSNAEIATALFNMAMIYKDKIEELPMAIITFNEFIRRFGTDERIPDAYFQLYMINTMQGNKIDAEIYRNKILKEFSDSKYQKILLQTDYTEHLAGMLQEQDSIYRLTYKSYNENDFANVFKQVAYIQQKYPTSTLMPKFLFLNALSIGKQETSDKFETALTELVKDYPQSDVSAMSKDILSLLKQGREVKNGTSSGSLLARRDEITKSDINNESAKFQFSVERQSKHRLLLITHTNSDNMNKLLYNIASFNFSRFMIKDFDLVISKLDTTQNILSVTNFESFDETEWYAKSIDSDTVLSKLLTDYHIQKVIISEENFALMKTSFSLNDYLTFLSTPKELKSVETKPIETKLVAATKIVAPKQVAAGKSVGKQDVIQIVKEVKQKTDSLIAKKAVDKPLVRQPKEVLVEKTVDKTIEKVSEKSIEKPVEKAKSAQPLVSTPKPEVASKTPSPTTTTAVLPKQEDVALFKNLFAYRANEPHYVAIYILSGTIDFDKTKKAIDAYNVQNYAVMNLKVLLEKVDNQQIIIIGSLSDANVAKSYLIRMVKEKSLFDGLKGASYRNLLGSQKNLNTLMQQNALSTYFEFMQEYYLK